MCRTCEGWGNDFSEKSFLGDEMVKLYKCSFCGRNANRIDEIAHSADEIAWKMIPYGIPHNLTQGLIDEGWEVDPSDTNSMLKSKNKCDGTHQILKNPYLNDDGSEKYILGDKKAHYFILFLVLLLGIRLARAFFGL